MKYSAVFLLAFAVAPTGWDYPNTVGQSGSASSGGKIVATSFSKQSQDSFSKVLAWYAKRTGFDSLPDAVQDYENRKPSEPDFLSGSADAIKVNGLGISNATAVYAFTPKHMHAMIVFSDTKSGDLMSISIAGDSSTTTITHVRRPVTDAPAG